MPPYPQKTDSREFEVANAEQCSGASGGDVRAGGSEIALRLWIANQTVPRTWKADSVLVFMIADLVAASGGRVSEAEQAGMSAKFESARQALVAAKRIQASILEFVACRAGERIGAAILIYQSRSSQSGSSDPSGLSGELARMALEKARPGQILFAENISQRVRDLPGMEFRAVDGFTGDGSGLTELLWTTAERLVALRDSVGADAEQGVEPKIAEFRSAERRSIDHPEVGATSIVQSPFARPGSAGGSVAKDGPRTASRRTDQTANGTQERAPGFEGFRESPGGSFGDGLDEFAEPPLFTRARVIFGAVALVLVTAVILVLFRPTKVSKPPLPLQPEQAIGTDNADKPPATTSTPISSQPVATTESSGPGTVPPPVKAPVAGSKASSKTTADNRGKSKKSDAEEAAPLDSGGVSQKDIPTLFKLAQADAGAGRYDEAKVRYKKILVLQPNNQDAKDALKRIEIAEGGAR